jgi:leucyl-tRNA synthetase
VTEHLEHLRFNSAVAQLYHRANAIRCSGKGQPFSAPTRRWKPWCCLSAPMMPHLAESCWQALGHSKLVADKCVAEI